MKSRQTIQLILLIIGALIFNYIFWNEEFGLNTVIFNLFLTGSLLYLYPKSIKYKNTIFTVLGSFITATIVIIHNSLLSIIIHYISTILMVAFIHQPKLKSILFAFITSITDFLSLKKTFLTQIVSGSNEIKTAEYKKRLNSIGRWFRIAVIPIIILFVFYFLFKFANPAFEKISTKFFSSISEFFTKVFQGISLGRLFFFLFGLIITAWFVYENKMKDFFNYESLLSDIITRKKKKKAKLKNPEYYNTNSEYTTSYYVKKENPQGLKNEFKAASFLLFTVNILLLFVNIIDINWIWFGFEYTSDFNLKQFVHEGTYLLIVSILLSMSIMVFYFRGNLNFYSKNAIIKYLSYIWIFQNIILVISVAIRNYHYITYWGLAYKRIGVIFFLLLVALGLITLYFKIKHCKSTFYLMRINGWSLYFVMIFMCFFNWDIIITKHNLAHRLPNNMETSFLLTLSDKTLPLIDEKKEILNQDIKYNTYKRFRVSYNEYYTNKLEAFIKRKKQSSWLSWNLAEQNAYEYFMKKN